MILTPKFSCFVWSWRLRTTLHLFQEDSLHVLQSQVTQRRRCLQMRLPACLALGREPHTFLLLLLLIYPGAVEQEIGVLWTFLSEIMGSEMPSPYASWISHVGVT